MGDLIIKQSKVAVLTSTMILFLMLGISAPSVAQNEGFFAGLKGLFEVPAISSTGIGSFRATLSEDETTINYELAYLNLEGDVRFAHIHFGQADVNGEIVVFLCTNEQAPSGVPMPPECPQEGTVVGSLTGEDITSMAADQGITTGESGELLAAMRAGQTYVNVHSSKFPGGEIRGQVIAGP